MIYFLKFEIPINLLTTYEYDIFYHYRDLLHKKKAEMWFLVKRIQSIDRCRSSTPVSALARIFW